MTTEFQQFDIDATLEFTANHFRARFVGSEPLRNKTATDTVNLSIGLIDSGNTPQTIAALVNGHTDEFEVTFTPSSVTGVKNGRDAGWRAVDYFFNKRYIREPVTGVIQQVVPPLGFKVIPEEVGQFFASTIAAEAAAFASLSLIWGIPDYKLGSTFVASGRVVDTIKRLVKPWQLVAPFQADVFIDAETIVVRQRNPNSAPDFSIDFTEARRSSLTVRAKRTQKYGQVVLLGTAKAMDLDHNAFVEGEVTETDLAETFDPTGNLLSRVLTTAIYSTPSKNLLSQVKETYTRADEGAGLFLSSRETLTNQWDPVAIDTAGPVTQKKHVSQLMVREGYDDNQVWQTVEQVDTGYSYDGTTFQTGETSLSKKFDPDAENPGFPPGGLVDDTLLVKSMREIGTLLVEQITENYQFQDVQSQFQSGTRRPVIQNRDTQTQAGVRPGGPGRARPRSTGDNRGQQEMVFKVISSDPDAVDVQESLPDFTLAMLNQALAQFQAASGLWQYEVILEGVNMPWIKRGMYLEITNVPSELTGVTIPLPVLLVTEVVSNYDESVQEAKSLATIRAFGWGAV